MTPLRLLWVLFLLAVTPQLWSFVAAPERAEAATIPPDVHIRVLAVDRVRDVAGITLSIRNAGPLATDVTSCVIYDSAGHAHAVDDAWPLAPGAEATRVVTVELAHDADVSSVSCGASY